MSMRDVAVLVRLKSINLSNNLSTMSVRDNTAEFMSVVVFMYVLLTYVVLYILLDQCNNQVSTIMYHLRQKTLNKKDEEV